MTTKIQDPLLKLQLKNPRMTRLRIAIPEDRNQGARTEMIEEHRQISQAAFSQQPLEPWLLRLGIALNAHDGVSRIGIYTDFV